MLHHALDKLLLAGLKKEILKLFMQIPACTSAEIKNAMPREKLLQNYLILK